MLQKETARNQPSPVASATAFNCIPGKKEADRMTRRTICNRVPHRVNIILLIPLKCPVKVPPMKHKG